MSNKKRQKKAKLKQKKLRRINRLHERAETKTGFASLFKHRGPFGVKCKKNRLA